MSESIKIRVFQTDDPKGVIEFISDIILSLYNEDYIINKRHELLAKIPNLSGKVLAY